MFKINLSVPSLRTVLVWVAIGIGALGIIGFLQEQIFPNTDFVVVERPVPVPETAKSAAIPDKVIEGQRLKVKDATQKQVAKFEKKYDQDLKGKNIIGEFKLGTRQCEYTFEFLETHNPETGEIEHTVKAHRKFFQLGGKWGVGLGIGMTNKPGLDDREIPLGGLPYRIEIPLRLEKDLFRTGDVYWNASVETDLAADVRKSASFRLMTIYRF